MKSHSYCLLMMIATALGLASCRGHLFFFTNTSLGLDVSADGATSLPQVAIGYKRQEGTTFPVIDRESNLLTDDGFSVLAKYNGGAGSGENADLQVAQFFATGQAAINLSKFAPGVLANDPEIAAAVNEFGAGILTSKTIPRGIKVKTLLAALQALEELGDPTSLGHVAIVNQHASKNFDTWSFNVFEEVPAGGAIPPKTLKVRFLKGAAVGGSDYQLLLKYSESLADSIAILRRVKTDSGSGWTEQPHAGGAPAAMNGARLAALDSALANQESHLVVVDKLIYESSEVVSAVKHFAARLFLTPEDQSK